VYIPDVELHEATTLEEAAVCMSPGIGFGDKGEGYVRLALVENEHRIRQAIRQMRKALSTADEPAKVV